MTQPPSAAFDLATLLSPLYGAEFFADYWEKKPYFLARGNLSYYTELLTGSDLENLLSDSDMRYPALRLAKGGHYYSPEAYTRNERFGDESFVGIPDRQEILNQYRAGATLALPGLHRTWPPLRSLCATLQAQLDHAPHANGYITPGNAAGFTPHYDVHDVFVLQIAGKKHWSVYAPVVSLPYRTQPFTPSLYTGQAPLAEFDLQAGDLLYLPRGFLHSTKTSDVYSAHVTIGITVYTWADLLKEYQQLAVESEDMRQALPPGFAQRADLRPLVRQKMLAAVERLHLGADPDRLLDTFFKRVQTAQTSMVERFRLDVVAVDAESHLRMPPVTDYKIVTDGAKTALDFKGRRYQVPTPVISVLNAMSALHTFRPSELPGDMLNLDARVSLSRHLLDIGFLTCVRA